MILKYIITINGEINIQKSLNLIRGKPVASKIMHFQFKS